MDFPNIDPVIIHLGPLAITWYSTSYVVGILLGWCLALRLVTQFECNLSKKNVDDLVTWAIVGIIVGGRLGYVFFYDPSKYFANPLLILKTYEGGMSFHGGFIGFILFSYAYCRMSATPYLHLMDVIAVVAPIGLFLGRIANFINGELYGHATDVPWGVIFPNSDGQARHPSQIYEALLEGLLLFVIMLIATYRYRTITRPGFNCGLFMIFYAVFRLFIELFRVPDYQIGYIAGYFTMGQILSAPMILLGIYMIARKHYVIGNKMSLRTKYNRQQN